MPKGSSLDESFTHDIAALVESFSEKDTVGKQSLSQLLLSDPRAFGASAVSVLAKSQPSPGARFLVHLLMKGKLLPACLLDPRTAGIHEAVTALIRATEDGAKMQPMLELALNKVLQEQSSPENTERTLRLLELLAAVAPPTLWNAFQLELMAHPDKVVRSKAALLVGQSVKNAAWIGRRFMDRDARVQASAVEALWGVDSADSRALLLSAAKSKHNRVAANAALGLYRIAEFKAIRMLLDMARQREDPNFRISAFWAIGETHDRRFLPFLMEQFKSSTGKIRLAITRAMGSIRRREKANAEAGAILFHVSQASISEDGNRHIAFALSSQPVRDLSALTPMEFSILEGGELIQDYEIKLAGSPAALAAGFVAPRFISASDPYGQAITLALTRVCAAKRHNDLWRVDRYSIEPEKETAEAPTERSFLPYDDAIATQEVKMRHCFIAAPEIVSRVITAELPRDRAAAGAFEAIQRQCEAIGKHAGKRHMFLFLHDNSVSWAEDRDRVRDLQLSVSRAKIVLHGFAPGLSHDYTAFRGLCLGVPGGTFSDATLDLFPAALEEAYARLMNGGEINYSLAAGANVGPVTLNVSSPLGIGQQEISLTTPEPPQLQPEPKSGPPEPDPATPA